MNYKEHEYRIKKLNAIQVLAFRSLFNFEDLDSTAKLYETFLENVEVNIEEVENEVILTVTNEAGEVKEEDLPYLFDRFFMANRVRSGEGTGIGLAVVKKLVELMNGKVKAELHGEQGLGH